MNDPNGDLGGVTQQQVGQWSPAKVVRSPFVKGLVGGLVGAATIVVVALVVYVGWTLYTDHQVLQQIIKMIVDAQKQAAGAAPK